MRIQWFPGHMTKAVRLIEENLKLVDTVGYVLDARAPSACFNPIFDRLTEGKSAVYILNKCDLADPKKVEKFAAALRNDGKTVVCVSAIDKTAIKKLIDAFGNAEYERISKFKAKGISRPVRAIIIGVPNCGKSTLINALSGKKKTITGDKPGVTKGKQWVRLADGLELLDTPGTLWGKIEDEVSARRLCFIGSVKDDVVDVCELAPLLLEELKNAYPEALLARYGVEIDGLGGAEILDAICKKRGYTVKGGEPDILRGAKAVLDDFRKGRIGKITFD